jgi:ATP/maltotriose-dependent transcriptional regulator MalT
MHHLLSRMGKVSMDVRSQTPTTPPPFVGRDREFALLQDRLTAAQGGRGSLVLISGEAGIGKSALADRLVRKATGARLNVLAGHCYDRTETPPYGPWIEIARQVQTLPDATNAPSVPRLDDVTSLADLFSRARDFLVALTAERPLVLVLEDLHWADSASLDLLRFIARGAGDFPLLLVATYRDEDVNRSHALAALVPLLVREAPTERLALRPLDTEDTQALVQMRYNLAESVTQRLATYLMERTEGNALFMTELLRSLEEEQLLDRLDGSPYLDAIARTPVPSLLQQIVDDRLARLGNDTSALLAVAAVIGQEVPLAVWSVVTGADEETLLTAVEHAEAAHLVAASTRDDSIRFTHALIRDVLYGHVSALRRRRLHLKVAEACVAASPPDPDTIAYHLLQAGDERATAWLVRAAERAEDAYALVSAAERYERALALLDAQDGDLAERGWLRLLVAALRRHEDLDRSYSWAEEAVVMATKAGAPSLVARARALHGLLAGYRSDYRTAKADLVAAEAAAERLPTGAGLSRREQHIDKIANGGTLTICLAYGGYLAEARTRGEAYLSRSVDAASTPEELGAIADVYTGLALTYAIQGEPVLARRSFAAASAAHHGSDQDMFAYANHREEMIHAVLPYQSDDLVGRERVAAAAARMAIRSVERGGHVSTDLPRFARVPLLVIEGQWREARRILDLPRTSDLALMVCFNVFHRGTIARAQGDTAMAWQCVHEPFRPSPETEPGEHFCPMPLQFHLLAAGLALDARDLRTARTWLDLYRRWLDFMDATLGRSDGEVLDAEWHRASGDTERAQDHATRALVYASSPRQPLALLAAHRMLGILDADERRAEAAEAHFAEALALATACHAPYERALTLIAQADFLAATDDARRARQLLDEARDLCLSMDARPALDRIARLVARLDGPADGPPAGLSARELDVLRLVAAGCSNAEIAERLFVSPNTVKTHVAHLLAKIGVPNRAAATEYAVRHGLV